MKTIAFYLPQYHEIPENNEAWGKGFTEWTNVKKAEPIIKKQNQPKIPLDRVYYNLLDEQAQKWQSDLAETYNLYGFCYYHYWFSGKLLLEQPAEQMLKNEKITTKFCFSWANEPWSKTWTGQDKDVIIQQEYGDESDWKEHFNYLLPFFKDDRYIKENGKPMFIIYKPDIIPDCMDMMKFFNEQAKQNGFEGLYFGFQFPTNFSVAENEEKFDFGIEFEPLYTRTEEIAFSKLKDGKELIKSMINNPIPTGQVVKNKFKNQLLKRPTIYDYVKTCERITRRTPRFKNAVPGMFTGWDKTPRNGKKATVYVNSTPEAFKKYLKKQVERATSVYNSEYLFITAWNEWGEGAYLEPDEEHGYAYLEALKEAQED
ncbi:glycosyltransferase WbsX family protein [Enterococcus larvae]|uniref:glycosyltransferase WbsX family protein n=1 Tax=Enterococcus larvae TaxID=2794352 RepID=UPI003F3C3371